MHRQAPDTRQFVAASAAEVLGRRIVTGDLTPGTTLPNLDQLAVQFSISRLSMRDAIKVLVGKGLVSSAPRRGTVVRPRYEWSRLDSDVLAWQIGDVPSAAFVRNLFELRRMIEPEAAALVAERASGGALAEIEQAFAQMVAADSNKVESIKADFAFHRSLLEATGNEFLAALAPAVEASLMPTFSMQRQVWPDPANFIPSHGAVMDAIKRGDPAAARAAMLALLAQAEIDGIGAIRQLGADADEAAKQTASKRVA